MIVSYHRTFFREYRKLSRRQQNAVDAALGLFKSDPHAPALYNHPLHGILKGKRSISAGFDLRLIFSEKDGYVLVEFLRVGTHSQLYD